MVTIDFAYNLEFEEENKFQEVYRKLSDARKKKVDACKLKQRKLETLASSYLLESLLKERGIQEPFCYDASVRGKPFLVDESGQRREGVSFSISHCKLLSVAAVTDGDAIGVDVESMGRYQEQVAERFFTEKEKQLLMKVTERENAKEAAQKEEVFCALWTGKEAIAKCLDINLVEVCGEIDLSEIILENVFSEPKKIFITLPNCSVSAVWLTYKVESEHMIACATVDKPL